MIRAKVTIRGTKPIIFHRFNIEEMRNLSKIKSGSSGNNPEEWRNGFFQEGGRLYMPGIYMQSAFKNGSVHTKVGRGTVQKTWISAVQIEDLKIFFNREMPKDWENISTNDFTVDVNSPVFLDICMVSNPNTKGRNIRYRIGCSIGWECSFSLLIDDTIISKEIVKKVVSDTGKLQGLADGRTLGYGRFEVLDLEFSTLDS